MGETLVFKFKEQGDALQRELTDEEKIELLKRQEADRKKAGEILTRASAGEDFAALVQEFSLEKEFYADGVHTDLKADDTTLGKIVSEMQKAGTGRGRLHWRVIENEDGLNIVKYVGPKQSQEMLLSHTLVCFDGKDGCAQPIPEIEASIRINN